MFDAVLKVGEYRKYRKGLQNPVYILSITVLIKHIQQCICIHTVCIKYNLPLYNIIIIIYFIINII